MTTIIKQPPPEKPPKKKPTPGRQLLRASITSLALFLLITGLFNIVTHQDIGSVLYRKTLELGQAVSLPPQTLILPPFSKASIGNEHYVLLGTQECPTTADIPPSCIVFPIHSTTPVSEHVKLISTSTNEIAHAKISLKSATSTSTILNIETIAAEHNGSIYITHFTSPYPTLTTQRARTEYGGPPPLNMEHPIQPPSNSPKTSTYNL